MNATLLKALVALVPTSMLFYGSVVLLLRRRMPYSLLQFVGACGIALVVLAHICEGLHLLPWMKWGLEHSAGHYVDLSGAILAFTLFPLGYLLDAKYAYR